MAVYPGNTQKNLPAVPSTMIVQEPETGMVEAILDGTYLTQLRTGAVQGAATDLLANPQAKVAALIGTGGQAESQLWAMLSVRDLEEVRIFDLDFERATNFASEMSEKYQAKIIAKETAQECVTGADIITSVTTSKRATFSHEWVKTGAHINGVGAYTQEMCEISVESLNAAHVIIFDTMEGVLSEAGDIIQALEKGLITTDDFTGELGELVLGQVRSRQTKQDITIFKTVGSAVLDVYVASEIVKKVKKKMK